MALPQFIIGGAPRSGTTWLYVLLDRHPQIYMAKPLKPEPKFFLIDELYYKGIQFYEENWFKNVPEGLICGEKSTNYLENSHVAQRIYKHIPWVKLIFILREPVNRAYSNYLWSKMNGFETEDFETAIKLENTREKNLPDSLKYARPFSYFSRGLYAKMLKPYFELFSKEQILCLRYEDIQENPEKIAFQVYDFLGIKRTEHYKEIGIVNPSIKEGEIPPAVREMLQKAYAEPNRQLQQLLGDSFEVWKYE